mgnify:CR=1 FL=1
MTTGNPAYKRYLKKYFKHPDFLDSANPSKNYNLQTKNVNSIHVGRNADPVDLVCITDKNCA